LTSEPKACSSTRHTTQMRMGVGAPMVFTLLGAIHAWRAACRTFACARARVRVLLR
jgi:hypothetical protein